MAVRKKGGGARAKATRARVVSPASSSHGSSSLSPVQSAHSELSHDQDDAAEQEAAPVVQTNDDKDEDTEMGAADEEVGDEGEDVEGVGEGEGDDGEDDEEEDGDEEEEEGGDEEDEEEDGEEDDEEEEEDSDDDEEGDEEEEADDGETKPAEPMFEPPAAVEDTDNEESLFRYPEAVPDFNTLSVREQAFKAARFLKCQQDDCDCAGLEPPGAGTVRQITRFEAEQTTEADAASLENEQRTKEGWWRFCGACSHGWEDEGHVWDEGVDAGERLRRGRVIGRIEELLQVRGPEPCLSSMTDLRFRTKTSCPLSPHHILIRPSRCSAN